MKYKVTAHKEATPPLRTGLTAALRDLPLKHSLYVPQDPDVPVARFRGRLSSITNHIRTLDGQRYSIRANPKGGYDIYRVE
jgi:hypothetical protein